MIDTHCHLTSKQFLSRQQEIIDRAELAGVKSMITVATDAQDAIAARDLAESDSRVYCSSGIHPLYAESDWNWDLVLEASRSKKLKYLSKDNELSAYKTQVNKIFLIQSILVIAISIWMLI
jgi:TatD DNase family protein